MNSLETLRARLPEALKDLKLNLQTVTAPGTLGPAQRLGVALSAAAAARHPELRRALVALTEQEVGRAVVEDALAAAALMGMNNVYYRFRHLVGKPSYAEKPARLRMQRIAKPATNKVDFELFCLAVSAVNGCENCIRAHEQVVTDGGLSEEQVNDAIRIASSVHGAAVALELAQDFDDSKVSNLTADATIP
jgi:lipoyl-dependent peroxiredoxin subunit D